MLLTNLGALLGNFNEMLHTLDKVGGTPLSTTKVQRLNEFLHYNNSHEANVQGRLLEKIPLGKFSL